MNYDTVIIGAGLSGLMCGLILAKEGQKVCITEKNPIEGGCTQNFNFRKKTFDPGAHYIGGIDEGQSLNAYWKYFGLKNKPDLRQLDKKAFDKIHFQDGTFALAQGKQAFVEQLGNDFPKEKKQIQNFVNYLEKSAHSFPGFNLSDKPQIPDEKIFVKNAYEEIQKYLNNKSAQNVLFGNSPAYDGHPEKTPFYIYALLTYGYIESAYRVIGGSGKIAQQLAQNFREAGGELRLNFQAEQILTDPRNKPFGIADEAGNRAEAKQIISTVHPAELMRISPAGLFRKAFRLRLNSLSDTAGVFSLYALLEPESFPFNNSVNYCINTKAENARRVYEANKFGEKILFLTQPETADQEYAQSLQLMTPMPYEQVKKWENTGVGKRGKDYRKFKRNRAEILLEKTEAYFPGIKSAVKHINTSTPLTYRDYTGTKNGSIYGIEKDNRNFMLTSIAHKTKIPNLYLAGQSVNIHGVHGTAAGAYRLCSYILGEKYLTKKIRNA